MRLLLLYLLVLCLCSCASITDENSRQADSGQSADGKYQVFGSDGAWCWFSDPRAVYVDEKVISGWVASDGSVMVASFDEQTEEIMEVNISPQFNQDDHANPSFLVLPDKRIMVFFSAHNVKGRGDDSPMIHYAITKRPADISEWNQEQFIQKNIEGPKGFCYTNPVMLSEEDNRIYLFWRGGDWKPTFSYSDGLGQTWSDPTSLIKSSVNHLKRPYIKVSTNGKNEIHFAFTDGHPRNEPLNSIYYLKYKGGKFLKADGSVIGTIESLPIEHEDCDLVYDANRAFQETRNGVRAWIWDVAADDQGNPVMVYTQLPEETKHEYYYAKWTGSEWVNSKIASAGSWFPRFERTKEMREPEPHYSGGISLDHENINLVYYSRPVGDTFEVFEAITVDDGATWNEEAITYGSIKDNVRPFAIRGADDEIKPQLLWMYNERYSRYKDYQTSIKINVESDSLK